MITAFVGQQVTVQGVGLGTNHSTSVEVAGVSVSGAPVLRTVLLNETAGMLWEVAIRNEDAINEWEMAASAAYSPTKRAAVYSARRSGAKEVTLSRHT